jgi:hypothetical protein
MYKASKFHFCGKSLLRKHHMSVILRLEDVFLEHKRKFGPAIETQPSEEGLVSICLIYFRGYYGYCIVEPTLGSAVHERGS